MGKVFKKINNIFVQARIKQREKEEALQREAITLEEVIRRYEEMFS